MSSTIEAQITLQERAATASSGVVQGKWIEVAPHLDPKFGGISAVVPELASTLIDAEHYAIELAAFCPLEQASLKIRRELQLTSWPSSRWRWLVDRQLRSDFSNMLSHADGVHIHGLWDVGTSVAARLARRTGTPYILSAHGMLEPWALRNKGLKKKMYGAFVERGNLNGAACLHALTHDEAADYRRFGVSRPIAVIPNGVDVPLEAAPHIFLRTFPALRDKRVVLFLGRIHFKKGIDLLIDAWAELAGSFADAVLVIAGPDADESHAVLERKIRESDMGNRVIFTGSLDAEMKWSALAAAWCFVLPSYSEGLSVAALEAMGMGLPVIVSTQCHLPEVETCGAGFVIQAKVPELRDALHAMLSCEAAAAKGMGEQGRRLVQRKFSWAVVARQMAELYAWVQGGAHPPSVEILQVSA